MELQVQPKGSSYCGQYALSMALGEDVRRLFAELGKPEDGTTCDQYEGVLERRKLNYRHIEFPDNRRRIDLSGKGVLSITNRARNTGHAMAFKDGIIYDPAGNVFNSIAEMKKHVKPYYSAVKVFSVITILDKD